MKSTNLVCLVVQSILIERMFEEINKIELKSEDDYFDGQVDGLIKAIKIIKESFS